MTQAIRGVYTMAIRDEIKATRKDLIENGTRKQKIAYFFDYYTVHTVVIVAVLIFAIGFIYHQVTKPEVVLGGQLINVLSFEEGNPVEDLKSGFMEYIDMNTKEYDFSLNSFLHYKLVEDSPQAQESDYTSAKTFATLCAAGEVDFVSSPLNSILEHGYGDLLVNLEDVLSAEDLAKYEPYFLYVDLAVVKQKAEAFENNMNPSDIPCLDPTKPAEMEQPIPIFIDVTKCEKMTNIYDYSSDTIVIAIAVNAPNPDRISDFLAYIFEE